MEVLNGKVSNSIQDMVSVGSYHYNVCFVGDNYCDDENNNAGCNYDGGDCCGDDVNTTWCDDCQCLDPSEQGGNISLYIF